MPFVFPCSECGHAILVRHLKAGEPAQCKSCRAVTPVPADAELMSDEDAAGYVAPEGSRGPIRPPTAIPLSMTTTTFTIDGYRTLRNIGLVRGLTVRSRSVLGTLGAELQTLVGGKITMFVELCEETREEALALMLAHAREAGANAVVGVRYDTTEVTDGVTEVICYGTALLLEEVPGPGHAS